jgi:hypothetical protein
LPRQSPREGRCRDDPKGRDLRAGSPRGGAVDRAGLHLYDLRLKGSSKAIKGICEKLSRLIYPFQISSRRGKMAGHKTETGMSNTPVFRTLSVDTIPALPDEALAAAACAAIDTLGDGAGGVEGALELLETDEADTLFDELWRVHLIPHIRRVPEANPYAGEETHEVQEALVGLLREAASRREGRSEPFYGLLNGLGDEASLDLANRVDAWRQRYPTPI